MERGGEGDFLSSTEATPVTMRLDEDMVAWLKGFGPGYQTKANLLLRHAMMNSGERKSTTR